MARYAVRAIVMDSLRTAPRTADLPRVWSSLPSPRPGAHDDGDASMRTARTRDPQSSVYWSVMVECTRASRLREAGWANPTQTKEGRYLMHVTPASRIFPGRR